MGAKGGLNLEVMLAAMNTGSGRNSATESKFPAAVLTRSFDYGGPPKTRSGPVTFIVVESLIILVLLSQFWKRLESREQKAALSRAACSGLGGSLVLE